MIRLLTLLLFIILFAVPSLSQDAGKYHIQQFTTDNGLPSNGIKGMQWDEQTGFLWLATEAGIVRFNGVDFRSFTKENMPEIASERMLFLVQNNAGKMYLADQPGNIFYIDKSKPVLWKKAATSNIVNPQLDNYYLLGVSDIFFNNKAENHISPNISAGFSKIICVSDTSCLILNAGKLFYYSTGLKSPLELPFENGNINTVFKINYNCFIINNKKEIFLLNIKDQLLRPVPIAANNNVIFKTATNNSIFYWQTGMDNPVFIDGEKAWLLLYDGISITTKLISTSIPVDSYIKSVQYSEKNDLLFIGTESKGLIVINQNRVQSKKRNNVNLKNRNSYYSQVELPDGNILTNESDIIGDYPINEMTLPIKGKFAFYVSQTDEISLWYSQINKDVGRDCLHEYNKATGQTKVYSKITASALVLKSGGKIYLASLYGIGILDGDSLRFLYKYPKNMAGTVIFDFAEINPGVFAVASCVGLLRFSTATNKLDTIFSKENICVRSIWKYKDYLFFGTYGSGFYMYKDGRVKSMPLDKNKYLLYPHCFMPDDEGYCWISTNRGLFKSSLAELVDAYENNGSSVYYHYFGKKDGMEMTELNGGCTPCALRLRDKTISFPTMDGLLWVNPEKATPILPRGEIFIDEIFVNSEKINADSVSKEKLLPQTHQVSVQLGFSAWCNKENIYLDYQLNDKGKWMSVDVNKGAIINLTNLGPGKYKLLIRKLNGFGINNYSYKEISFTILTPWHQQWWFYILCTFALFGIIAIYLKWRTRQYQVRQKKLEQQVAEKTKALQKQNEVLEKNNVIKTRLISIISHDIVTPLKFLTVAGKNLIEKRKQMPEELQQETIQEMTNTSQELQLLSTNILNWIKYQNENRRMVKETFNLHEMVRQVLGLLQSLARPKKLVIENQVAADMEIRQYYEPLKILVYNLLTNAIHFTEKGMITVSAVKENEHIIVTVEDEGAGMTTEQIQRLMADDVVITSANVDNKKGHGLGYLIIKDLLKTMGASLTIKSEKGNGTAVSICLPVNGQKSGLPKQVNNF
jgi:signal transduction histidine kinase